MKMCYLNYFVTYAYSFLKNVSPKVLFLVFFNVLTIDFTSPPAQNAFSPVPSIITNLLDDSHFLSTGYIFSTIDKFRAFSALERFNIIIPLSPTLLKKKNTYKYLIHIYYLL